MKKLVEYEMERREGLVMEKKIIEKSKEVLKQEENNNYEIFRVPWASRHFQRCKKEGDM